MNSILMDSQGLIIYEKLYFTDVNKVHIHIQPSKFLKHLRRGLFILNPALDSLRYHWPVWKYKLATWSKAYLTVEFLMFFT